MFVTLVAFLCEASSGPTGRCVEEIVTDTSLSNITFQSCMIDGQIGIAQWMSEHPIYRAGWTLRRYKCVLAPTSEGHRLTQTPPTERDQPDELQSPDGHA
jgi:hypothetical protein